MEAMAISKGVCVITTSHLRLHDTQPIRQLLCKSHASEQRKSVTKVHVRQQRKRLVETFARHRPDKCNKKAA